MTLQNTLLNIIIDPTYYSKCFSEAYKVLALDCTKQNLVNS